MNFSDNNYAISETRTEVVNVFLRSIYNWMLVGLGITAAISYVILNTSVQDFFYDPEYGFTSSGTMVSFGAMIATIIMSFVMQSRRDKMEPSNAKLMFVVYSSLMGIGLAPILLSYTQASVAQAFISAAAMFGATSIYGLVTKRDLSSLGSFMMMGLIGVIIAMVVNMFFQSPMFDIALSMLCVIIFVGLTAYETQLFKEMGQNLPQDDQGAIQRGAILGALQLYLNFINIFISLLRLMGDRR